MRVGPVPNAVNSEYSDGREGIACTPSCGFAKAPRGGLDNTSIEH